MRPLVPLLYALKRIASSYALALCILAGFTASVALSISIPLYSSAVSTRMLREELSKQPLPPYAFLFTFNGPLEKEADRSDFTRLDRSLGEEVPSTIGLPALSRVRHVAVDTMQLLPTAGTGYSDTSSALEWMSFGTISGLEPHARLLEGTFPRAVSAGEPVEVLMTQVEAEKLGLEVGDQFVLSIDKMEAGSRLRLAVPVRLSGVWEPEDAERSYWFYQPGAYDQMALTDEQSFWRATAGASGGVPFGVTWYMVFDGSAFRVDQTARLLAGIARVKAQLASFDSRPSLIYSPEEALRKYSASSSQLTILLFAFALPVFALIFYLIFLLSHITVERRKNEIALLRSRGTARRRVVATQLLQSLLLVVAALPLGVLLGTVFAQVMDRTRTFLVFEGRAASAIGISAASLAIAAVAALCALLGAVLPAIRASRETIVSYKRERARSRRRPAWERYFLDVVLFAISAYGYYTLRSRGTLVALVSGGALDDPFKNPLLFFVPTLFLLSTSLLFLRVFPRLMEGLAHLLRRTRGAPLVLAVRAIARSPGSNRGLLLLVCLTLGLAGYTASMAKTLDLHATSEAYYSVGSDVVFSETGAYSSDTSAIVGAPERWEYPPLSDYTAIPGVLSGTRVGAYKAEIRWTGKLEVGRVIGIERDSFAEVAFFRGDFARRPLRELLEALSLDDAALLVQRDFFQRNQLRIGQHIPLVVTMHRAAMPIDFVVAGVLDYFPTAYPDDGPFFVGNLPYLFYQSGGDDLHDVWLRTDAGLTGEALQNFIIDRRLTGTVTGDTRTEIQTRMAQPDRQGMFGLLSIGFLAAAFVTALGFLVQSVTTYQGRSVELGILRAMGLSLPQMVSCVLGEQVWLASLGAAAGTLLGYASSLIFIPFLQAGAGTHAGTPPMIVTIAWQDLAMVLAVFAGMLLATMAVMVFLLLRLRVFEAIKLDEVS